MKHSEFEIGKEFTCGDHTYRCTDKGTRVVAAIRVSQIHVMRVDSAKLDALGIKIPHVKDNDISSSAELRVLDRAQAEAEGWFNGPPYAACEHLFDEYAQEGCEPCPS